MKRIIIDIDGTIGAYPQKAAKIIRSWRLAGAKIIIWTSRCTRHQQIETVKLLEDWGIEYDELVFNKPEGDVLIDDRALEFIDWEETERRMQKFIEEPHEWDSRKWREHGES